MSGETQRQEIRLSHALQRYLPTLFSTARHRTELLVTAVEERYPRRAELCQIGARPAVDRRSVSAPVEAVASLEADLDALRRDVASLKPRQQASRPTWLLAAAVVGLALAAWILTPEDPYATALAS